MWTFLLSPLGRKIGLGIAAAVALFVAVKWYEGKVREDERAKQADKQTQEIEKLRAADRAQVQEVLNEAQAKQEAAERRMQASLDREARLVQTIASLSQQRAVVANEVQRLSDSERRPYIIRALGLRQAGDNSPCFNAAEEKAIVDSVTQFPLCQKQVETQNAQIAEIKGQIQDLKDKTAAMEVKWDALSGYTSRLEGWYTQVYNTIPRKKRSPKCLWIWACGKKPPLPVPAPLDLKKPAP